MSATHGTINCDPPWLRTGFLQEVSALRDRVERLEMLLSQARASADRAQVRVMEYEERDRARRRAEEIR